MPRQTPFRPRVDAVVTQGYGDGVVAIYSVKDVAQPGYQPKPQTTLKCKLRYEEQRLGIQRYYAALQNQVQVERVIRTARAVDITTQDVAITEDGRKYAVYMVQSVQDVYPPSVDITLSKISQGVGA